METMSTGQVSRRLERSWMEAGMELEATKAVRAALLRRLSRGADGDVKFPMKAGGYKNGDDPGVEKNSIHGKTKNSHIPCPPPT